VASGDAVGQWFLPDSLFVNKPVDVLLRPQSGGLPSGPRARISVAPRDRPYRRRAAPPVIRSDRPGRWRSARGPSCGESDKQRRPGDRPESKRYRAAGSLTPRGPGGASVAPFRRAQLASAGERRRGDAASSAPAQRRNPPAPASPRPAAGPRTPPAAATARVARGEGTPRRGPLFQP
jgi:hypothetical protein